MNAEAAGRLRHVEGEATFEAAEELEEQRLDGGGRDGLPEGRTRGMDDRADEIGEPARIVSIDAGTDVSEGLEAKTGLEALVNQGVRQGSSLGRRGRARMGVHAVQNVAAEFFVAYGLGVLGGNDYGVHANGFVIFVVFDCDLRFAVGPEVREGAILADFGKALTKFVRQENWRRHVVAIFVAGIAEHHALVAGATGVNAHGDVARLLVDAGDDRAGVGIEAVERVVIADGGDHTAHQRLEIDVSLGGNFTGDDDQSGCGQRLASHAAVGIVFQAGIEDRVGDLIGDLVGVTLGHGFGCKQVAMVGQIRTPFILRHSGRLEALQLDTMVQR